MASSVEAAAGALIVEIRRQLETWNHRPAPADDATLEFPHVGGVPLVQHNERPLLGRYIAVGTFGRQDDAEPAPAAEWWTRENRERYALHCQHEIRLAADALIDAARASGGSAVLLEPLRELRKAYDDFLRAALRQDGSGLTGDVCDAWLIIHLAADKVCELVDELATDARVPDLCGTQDAVYRVLTAEYQSALDIAALANVSDDETRKQLANLKRMGLADHKNRVGYRRR